MDAEFVEEIELPLSILGAIKFKDQAQFNPCKYAEGLVNSMQNNNTEVSKNKKDDIEFVEKPKKQGSVKIFENTKAVDIKKENDEYEVITESGRKVKAKYVVIATHYPIINFPGYYFLKMYQSMSYVIAVEVPNELFKGMYINSELPTMSFRMTKDGDKYLLIVAGLDHKTGEKDDMSDKYNNLLGIAKQIYPDSKIKYKWCTEDCISLDKIPYIGEFSSLMPNVYVGTGYKKWGMTTSNIAANIIVDKILGKVNADEEVFTATRLKPIKNYQEMGNMIKEVVKSLVIEKFKIPEATLKEIKEGDARVVEVDGKKIGIFKEAEGKLYAVKPVCTHLGCELTWNNLEKTWDCPCHGSRFDYTGKSIYAPSIYELEKVEIE